MSLTSATDQNERANVAEDVLDDVDDHDALLRSESDLEEASKLVHGKPGIWVWTLTVTSGISGLLFGCEYNVNLPEILHTSGSVTNGG
jgi:hypothetical protein